ncbi:pseudouridine synthase [Marinobacter changyiensis]|uniref:pseudouridine synthase n=1 Tax=Marinobacter changyiensis TaxID=2604091 RepID=UPI00126499C5|nr:pseudouridine synthase [Marinobacter changyiensis]
MRLTRILSNHSRFSRRTASQVIADGRVAVDGEVCRDPGLDVSRFRSVTVDEAIVQKADRAHYLMLNKPAGYLSATKDLNHQTVLDLIEPELRTCLHIGGRLDRASSGLLILTNDGIWSRRLTEPRVKIPKVYRVTTAMPITAESAASFAEGIWFAYEGLTTSPASLSQLSSHEALVTIYEGRYHQVKRMFHAVGNRVLTLHRQSMGNIRLDETLAPGQYRALSAEEVLSIQ